MLTLAAYGENAFTFLFFKMIADDRALLNIFLSRLKRFATAPRRRARAWPVAASSTDDVKIWLFPNFGKRIGFGEPDALILIPGHAFWVEVETSIRADQPAALHAALLQLARFHILAHALVSGRRTRRARDLTQAWHEIAAITLSNDRRPREARLRRKGHPVLQEDAQALMAPSTRHHLVLFSEAKPIGPGGNRKLRAFLADQVLLLRGQILALAATSPFPAPVIPGPEDFHYVFWRGDLTRKIQAATLKAYRPRKTP